MTAIVPPTTKAALFDHTGLLPYAIRKCTAKEMLYGGIRVQYLVQKRPSLTFHRSAAMRLPTPGQEIKAVGLEYLEIPIRMMPVNVGHQNKYEMSIIRNKDVYKRWLQQNRAHADAANAVNGATIAPIGLSSSNTPDAFTADGKHAASSSPAATSSLEARKLLLRVSDRKMYHVSKDKLSILGPDRVGTKEAAFQSQVKPKVPTMGTEVFGIGEGFMPLQMVKPVHHSFSPAQRTSGLTSPAGRLKQELLDRKGFGWQKKQRTLWNQDSATRGYHPDKYY